MWRALWMPTHLVGESDIYITNLPRLNCENTYYCLRNLPELVVKTERSQYVTWPKSHLQFPQENLSVCCDLVCLYITSCLISHPCLYSPHKHEENRSKLQIFFFFFFFHHSCSCVLFFSAKELLWHTDTVFWQEGAHAAVSASFIFTLTSVMISSFSF